MEQLVNEVDKTNEEKESFLELLANLNQFLTVNKIDETRLNQLKKIVDILKLARSK